MAALIHPDAQADPAYKGLNCIFEYINDDGDLVYTNCGLAAAATLLTHLGKYDAKVDLARAIMHDLEAEHPPDNLGGYFGTSRRRVTRICRAHGVRLKEIAGEERLRKHLSLGAPVIVMLGVSAGKFLSFDLPGGHWMVAYGFDGDHVYLTNWGRMSWQEFHAGWNALVPRLINMRGKGLVAVKEV